MNRIAAFASTLIFLAGWQSSAAAAPRQDPQHQDPQQATQGESKIDVTLYPILAQVPIFGAKIDIPDLPSLPGASGTTDLSLNGAFLAGVIVESRRWLLDVNGLWAAVSADHPDPLTNVDTHTAFVNVTGGVRIDSKFWSPGSCGAMWSAKIAQHAMSSTIASAGNTRGDRSARPSGPSISAPAVSG